MPKQSDYSKTQIYRLVCKNLDVKECYIGSTVNWIKRKSLHKSRCNNEIYQEYNEKKYVFIRANGGWSAWEMVLVEDFPCENNLEAKKRERYWQEHFASELNMRNAYINKEQKKEQKKEYDKDYKIKHAKEIKEHQKQNYIENADKIKEQQKLYKEQNKDKIKEQQNEKITCECGIIFTRSNKIQHLKSKKHIQNI
jgi:hypothetical protein